ncbi:PREDICTED: uncharacterized protein LOC109580916 isoform X2 [Amphimedon queenslandica]|uniref:Uncharacterized protein n=1 Tax=Amphimedon queenslandica TaxID=400682 RepID=A0AAN0J022_AMPQE|nr:PREDICTED: uncharacterized protein LOC109580916 isoform X2 [Amphimedon queenslandica]|eukprot:XP_019850061.1 PREDICTED: uncharacterized protein LOC109580916 isoform X2 [Amphimedon queenslandica]
MASSKMATPNRHYIKEDRSCLAASVERPPVLCKRQRNEEISEDEDDGYCHVKRFLSEEQMASRLEHLQLATPPYSMPTYAADEFLNQAPSNEYCFANDWNYVSCENNHVTQLELFNQSNLFISLNSEGNNVATQDMATPLDYEFEATPTDDVSLFDEENGSDSSDNTTPPQLWIAPEVKSILKNSSNQSMNLLPPVVVNEINRPCTALVLYKEPDHIRHHVWKRHNSQSSDTEENNSSDVYEERIKTSAIITEDDEMEL